MKAFLLAAGKGKRLLPYTLNNPKPLVKVGGISLIERNIIKLKEADVKEIVINVHHFGEKIINLLGDGSRHGLKISYSIEEKLLGTGGGIQNAIDKFDDPFIALSADTWTDYDFTSLNLNKEYLAHMVLIKNKSQNLSGDVYLNDGLIGEEGSHEKYTFSGVSILSPDLFIHSQFEALELWNDILRPAALEGLVSGEIYQGTFENLNTLEDVERLDGLLSEE